MTKEELLAAAEYIRDHDGELLSENSEGDGGMEADWAFIEHATTLAAFILLGDTIARLQDLIPPK